MTALGSPLMAWRNGPQVGPHATRGSPPSPILRAPIAWQRRSAASRRRRSLCLLGGYLAADREAEIDRLPVDAYPRQRPEDLWSNQAAKRIISAEPS